MTKSYAQNFWNNLLTLINRDRALTSLEKPDTAFLNRARAGDYDDLSDEEYAILFEGSKEEAVFWENRKEDTAGNVFLKALSRTVIDEEQMTAISDLLADCSLADYRELKSKNEDDVQARHYTPKEIYGMIDRKVYGQQEAKKAASLVVYNWLEGRRSNVIFCGPTGCGKSEIWRCLAREFPDSIRIVDASRLSADGWKGSVHVRDFFEGTESEMNALAKRGRILVLDEADKLCCERAYSSNGTDYNALVQNSLLKMLDGDVISFGKEDNKQAFSVDCSKVSVVMLGAFEYLMRDKGTRDSRMGFGGTPRITCDYSNTEITHEDLVQAGMRREIAGRINFIVPLNPLDEKDYQAILTGLMLEDLQCFTGKKILLSRESIEYLCQQAVSSRLGVRWMRSRILRAVYDLEFDDPDANEYSLNLVPNSTDALEPCP